MNLIGNMFGDYTFQIHEIITTLPQAQGLIR